MATETSITSKFAAGGIVEGANKGTKAPIELPMAQMGRQKTAAIRQGAVVEQAQVSRKKIDKVVSELRDFAQTMQRDLNFHVDDVTGHVVIRVVDASTDKVVRQIPEEEVLSLARRLEGMLEEMPKGVLIEGEA